jgi:excisionase family DNA binding protein
VFPEFRGIEALQVRQMIQHVHEEHRASGVVAPRLAERVAKVDRATPERRITFVRVGRHVRIPEGAIEDLITRGTVEPIGRRRRRGAA